MNTDNVIDITILGREFRINCPHEECDQLLLASSYLDEKMRRIKEEGNIIGSERIAIAAALSITHELLMLQTGSSFDMSEFKRRIGIMEDRLDDVLVDEKDIPN
jgi:cell division protein ZapA